MVQPLGVSLREGSSGVTKGGQFCGGESGGRGGELGWQGDEAFCGKGCQGHGRVSPG